MHHVRVALDRHLLGHRHAADFSDAADIVAAEVEQHHMLGALLRIGGKLRRERLIGITGCAAGPRSGNRAQRDRRSFLAHEDLRRCADDMEIAKIIIEHVRRRIE